METDNKEVAWILQDENTKPINISFDDEPTYVVENDTNYTMNVQPPATFSAICKMRPSKIVKILWGIKLKWYQAIMLDLIFCWKKRSKLCIQTLSLKSYMAAFPSGHK